jgi:hypothetical protein
MDDLISKVVIWQDDHWVDRSALLKVEQSGKQLKCAAKVVLLSLDHNPFIRITTLQFITYNIAVNSCKYGLFTCDMYFNNTPLTKCQCASLVEHGDGSPSLVVMAPVFQEKACDCHIGALRTFHSCHAKLYQLCTTSALSPETSTPTCINTPPHLPVACGRRQGE